MGLPLAILVIVLVFVVIIAVIIVVIIVNVERAQADVPRLARDAVFVNNEEHVVACNRLSWYCWRVDA